MCVIGEVASRACYIGVIGLSEGGPVARDQPGTNTILLPEKFLPFTVDRRGAMLSLDRASHWPFLRLVSSGAAFF